MKLPSELGISVVIVNWNSRDDLDECLRSLAAQTDADFETIVVDNGSRDGSCERVRSDFPHVVLVDTGENLGFAEGMNRGIAAAAAPWIFALNNDAVAAPDLMALLRARLGRARARDGMFQPRILFRQHPERTNSTGMLLFADGTARDRDFDCPAEQSEEAGEIFCPTAGAALYRRAMLDEVRLPSGYFDRSFFMYAEDLDLGWRCRLAGWAAHYLPEAKIYHAFQGSARRRGSSFVEQQCAKNRLRVLLKNASPGFILRSVPRTVGDVARLAWAGGPAALPRGWRAARRALAERTLVGALARDERQRIEQQWSFARGDRRISGR